VTLWFGLIALLLAVVLDLTLGDPPNRWHPVVWMGSFIRRYAPVALRVPAVPSEAGGEGILRGVPGSVSPASPAGGRRPWDWPAFLRGMAVTLVGATLFSAPLWVLLHWLTPRCWPLALVINVVGLKLVIAYRGLVRAAREVGEALRAGDLPEAQRLLSWHLVSRDTRRLTPGLVAAATVESVAENLTDGVAAPVLFYMLGGLPAAWAYRYINTCDSMLGYRDAAREYLGKFPARLDDLLNYVPARLTALAIIAGAAFTGAEAPRALATAAYQHGRTASPNAGWTMSAMAGALGVTLEKVGHYRLEGGSAMPDAKAIEAALAVARATLCVLVLAAVAFGALWLPLARHWSIWP